MKFIRDLFSEQGNVSSRRLLLYFFSFVYIWHFILNDMKEKLSSYTEEQFVQILMLLIFAVVFDKVPNVIGAFKSGTEPGGDRPKNPPPNP